MNLSRRSPRTTPAARRGAQTATGPLPTFPSWDLGLLGPQPVEQCIQRLHTFVAGRVLIGGIRDE